MSTKSNMRFLKDGYKYRKIEELAFDNSLCSAKIELFKENQKVVNRDEVENLMDLVIEDLMQDEYFDKRKVVNYSLNGNVIHEIENLYTVHWPITPLFSYKLEQLEEYCNGKEIEVLSGEFKNKIGLYEARKTRNFERKIEEYIKIDGIYYDLLKVEFEFVNKDDQLSWESIMEE